MEWLFRGTAKIAYALSNVVVRIMFFPIVTWEDKQATKAALKEKCVIYCNHTSLYDGLYVPRILGKNNVHTFTGKDWYEKKKINWLFRNLPFIPVNRQEMDTSWLDLGVKKIEEHNPIFIFPEGRISRSRIPHDFKPGFLMLAKRADAVLIPVCVDSKYKLFHPMHIIIGAPQKLDLNEDGRPSQVLKKYCGVCRDANLALKEKYGKEKYRITEEERALQVQLQKEEQEKAKQAT